VFCLLCHSMIGECQWAQVKKPGMTEHGSWIKFRLTKNRMLNSTGVEKCGYSGTKFKLFIFQLNKMRTEFGGVIQTKWDLSTIQHIKLERAMKFIINKEVRIRNENKRTGWGGTQNKHTSNVVQCYILRLVMYMVDNLYIPNERIISSWTLAVS